MYPILNPFFQYPLYYILKGCVGIAVASENRFLEDKVAGQLSHCLMHHMGSLKMKDYFPV